MWVARLLVQAERTAPAEITHRPVARDILAEVARDPTTIAKLAATFRGRLSSATRG
ncbi:hypothetical protein AB0B85_12075 [Micromonospora sp. NPDC049044]|uniref:hypothetical protein n=1 Tax=unclassified Micromonospora TaxID=2617518 RepID=UPI0033C2B23D